MQNATEDEIEGISTVPEDLEMSPPPKLVPYFELKEKVLPKKSPKSVSALMFQQALIRNKERQPLIRDMKQVVDELEETVDRLKDLEASQERKYRKMVVRQSLPSIRSELSKGNSKLPMLSQSVIIKGSSQR
jgi:hypothetical protein